ncbi:DUF4105 domain-containing protein [Aggregatimonas sangjinii]|uniref:DUF4105 domain-containing protein n=1 Tax=Aggregatimonas sangjinii TaxID=2583587 RepID=A0A5B7SV62_9FLAO|nr:DUF4105 domain-containing protein [Aggregatimonas sangjinii]QCX00720.1 DUF4105 domain-containing protein [Aggregatimonas sangjinii]
MRSKIALIFIGFLWGVVGFCQQTELSPLSKVSVLTVGTADELHSKFGHSAIRIVDPTVGLDIVYNYGMFDFDDPDFYIKFTHGKLDYRIAKESFPHFIRTYEYENRWVKEQVLDLQNADKEALLSFLENNLRPENRYYKYDFLFDNCATRIPDALQKATAGELVFRENHLEKRYTFRELIHQNLKVNSWSNFGIDLALGSVIDKEATAYQHMFLPHYVFDQLNNTAINGKSLVSSQQELLAQRSEKAKSNFLASPLFWLPVLMVLVMAITYFDNKKLRRSRWIDFFLFFVTGIAGAVVLFLWFATDHQATKINFNFLWAFAPNLILAFVLLKKRFPNWLKLYIAVLLALLGAVPLLWIFKIQVFSPLILFILVSLCIRYLFLLKLSKMDNTERIVID